MPEFQLFIHDYQSLQDTLRQATFMFPCLIVAGFAFIMVLEKYYFSQSSTER